jgi:hypothetical protein
VSSTRSSHSSEAWTTMKKSSFLSLIGVASEVILSPSALGAPIMRHLSGEPIPPPPPDDDDLQTLAEAPANDMCEDAEMVQVGTILMATTKEATADLFSPCGASLSFFLDSNETGIWYAIEGTGRGLIAQFNNTFNMQVAVFLGSCDERMCVDEAAGYIPSSFEMTDVKWGSYKGEMYYILVTGSGGAEGEFTLEVMEGEVPENSDCEADTVIEVGEVVNGTTEFARIPDPLGRACNM